MNRRILEQRQDGAPRIPSEVPSRDELPDRLDSVLRVIYLVFNEGYSASSGVVLTRHDLSAEAIRIGRLLGELLPEPEVLGLLALMLLHESRRTGRRLHSRSRNRSGGVSRGSWPNCRTDSLRCSAGELDKQEESRCVS